MAIPECKITEEEVKIAVSNTLKGAKYEIVDFKIGQANETTLGYLGEHTRIVANVTVNGEKRTLKYFAKKMVTKNKSHREYCEGVKAFYKEVEHYKTLFADLEDVVPEERRESMKWRPDCLYTRDHDLLIVEDLSPLGYYMLPDRSFMPLEHIKMALRSVAKMHACSIIFEEKLTAGLCKTRSPKYAPGKGKQEIGELYPNLTFETECTDISEDHPGYWFWKSSFPSQKGVIDVLPDYTEEQKAKIYTRFLQVAPTIFRMVEPSKEFRNVMCHGDLWGNNIMFLDGPDGKVAKAVLVDYQTTRYAPPALDLYTLIHLTQDITFRQQNEAQLKEFFYTQLEKELAVEKLDIKTILPKEEWDESCVFYKRFAILQMYIYTQLNYAPSDMADKVFATEEGHRRLMYGDRAQFIKDSIAADNDCRTRNFEAMEEIIQAFDLLA